MERALNQEPDFTSALQYDGHVLLANHIWILHFIFLIWKMETNPYPIL